MIQSRRRAPSLSVVAPVYNEEECIEEFLTRTLEVIQKLKVPTEILLIDDGSSDGTVAQILKFKKTALKDRQRNNLIALRLGKMPFNVGHQKALICGMKEALGKAVITIDSDLQDPPEQITKMYEVFGQGHEIVLMKRYNRSPSDSWIKKFTAKIFYKFLSWISDVPQETEVGDFRLLSLRCNKIAVELSTGAEYIRGVINSIGVTPVYLEYKRDHRYAGKTKYSLGKMMNLGVNAVVKTSLKPLRKSIYFGGMSLAISILYSIYVLTQRILDPSSLVKGYTTLLVVNLWGFSILFVLISTLSQYVVRIIEEGKNHKSATIETWL